MTSLKHVSVKKITKLNFLWMAFSQEPFVALYALLPFILAKDLGASALQISLFIAVKPILSVFSYFWHAFIQTKHPHLKKHLMIAWGLAFIPFLIYPPLNHLGFVLLAASCYQLFSKAAMPPFHEICRQTLDPQERKKLISNTYLVSFLISAVLGLFFGRLLDKNPSSWKVASACFALLALSSLLVQKKLPNKKIVDSPKEGFIFGSLKKSFEILKASKEFQNFQIGFMIGGSALMFIAPALTLYYVDTLELSHNTYTQARTIFMSLGIICSTPLWKKALRHYSLNALMPWITLLFGLFPLIVLSAYLHKPLLYSAFMIYGIAQAGSHLIWTLSGTFFAQDKDSNPYTALNILTQGIRGCFAPLLGGVCCHFWGPLTTLVIGALLALWGAYVMTKNNQKAIKNL